MLNRLEKRAAGIVNIIDNSVKVVRVYDILHDQVTSEADFDPPSVPEETVVEERCVHSRENVPSLNIRFESR
ncbi:MAG: hypothetical protein L0154_05480 [Chloroflexi bacterium]|nr:hypothetical protein [Chloroflexota bacterium]